MSAFIAALGRQQTGNRLSRHSKAVVYVRGKPLAIPSALSSDKPRTEARQTRHHPLPLHSLTDAMHTYVRFVHGEAAVHAIRGQL